MSSDDTQRIMILLQAKDEEFQRTLKRTNATLARAAKQMERDTSQANRAMDAHLKKSGMSFTALGTAATVASTAVIASLAVMAASARTAIAEMAGIADISARIGMSAEDFQALQFGMQMAGVEANEFAAAMEQFALRTGDAANGQGALLKTLRDNGVVLRDGAGQMRSQIDLLRDFADVVADAGSEQERLSLINDAFGRGGKSLAEAMGGGAEALDHMIQKAIEGGMVLDNEVIARAAELDDKFEAVTRRIDTMWKTAIIWGAEFFGMFEREKATLDELFDKVAAETIVGNETAEALRNNNDAMEKSREMVNDLAADYEYVSGEVAGLVLQLSDFSTQLQMVGDIAGSNEIKLLSIQLAETVARFRDGKTTGEQFNAELNILLTLSDDAGNRLGALNGISFDGVAGRIGALTQTVKGLASWASQAVAQVAALADTSVATTGGVDTEDPRRHVEFGVAPTESRRPVIRPFELGVPDLPAAGSVGGGSRGGGGAARDDWKAEVEAIRARTAALEAEAAALLMAADGGETFGDAVEYAKKKAELLVAAQKAGREITPELTAEIEALAGAYVTAGDSADEARARLEAMRDQTKEAADALADMFVSIFDGSKSAGEALRDLALQMAATAAKQQLLNALMGAAQGGGWFSRLLQGIGGALSPTPSYARGTGMHPGGMARINEVGGELVNLPRGATVVPHDLSRRMVDNVPAMSVHFHGGGITQAEVRTEERRGPNGERQMHVTFLRMLKEAHDRGEMDGTLSRLYGVKRKVS